MKNLTDSALNIAAHFYTKKYVIPIRDFPIITKHGAGFCLIIQILVLF
jgi:hypothetical protein